jgi:ornithine--oxo-acid transaminase
MAGLAQQEAGTSADAMYADHVNPQWVKLLDALRMNVRYERCAGAELHLSGGRRILDFLSGYCVHNTGHNHPRIIAAIQEELEKCGPLMLQSHVPERAGELAARLCRLAGGRLNKVFFCSSGSEGVEAAIKFARAHTARPGILFCDGAFHGLTCGALSLTGNPYWTEGFGPLLPGAESVPFGDLERLEQKLKTRGFAAFIVEPIQSEAGIRIPEASYLRDAQALCRRHGSLFVLDEVQTGLFRTGPFLAAHHFGVEPDMVVLAKALSGGLIPSAALLMPDSVNKSVFSSVKRAIVHTSTYGENGLAMRVGLAALDVLEQERLGERAAKLGERLRERLRERLPHYAMVRDVRGLGLLCGIEFQPPAQLRLRILFEAFRRIHEGMFGQVVVMRLFNSHNVLTQMCGNNFLVLKAAPPLVVEEAHLDEFVRATEGVVEAMHSSAEFWSEPLGIARRLIDF